MSDFNFKAGDPIYYPNVSTQVLKLGVNEDAEGGKFSLCLVSEKYFSESFTPDGFLYTTHIIPSIFHATQENYELLSKLYPNVTFEPPPKEKEPREVIEAIPSERTMYMIAGLYASDKALSIVQGSEIAKQVERTLLAKLQELEKEYLSEE